jgi:hypothetical protein
LIDKPMPKKPKPQYITPALESITVGGKYFLPETDFSTVEKMVNKTLSRWVSLPRMGESLRLVDTTPLTDEKGWFKQLRKTRPGIPVYFSIVVVEHSGSGMLVEVECRPAMWHKISQLFEVSFTVNQVQEALIECKTFVKQVMSVFGGKEVEPVSVYPIIPRMEVKSRLLNLGLKEIVEKLAKAEEHIVQNDFAESLKSSRTAFEKMIDWQMNKRGLSQTNSYQNNLERIKSKGYLDPETTKLLQTYYECLSLIVHEKGAKPGIYEAQMGYGITLIMLDYFANKLP